MSQKEYERVEALEDEVGLLNDELEETSRGLMALTLELKKAEEKYRKIFEGTTEGIYQVAIDKGSNEARYVTANDSMAAIFGYTSPESFLEGVTDINSQIYDDPEFLSNLLSLLNNQKSVSDHVSLSKDKNGDLIWISENINGIYDDNGTLVGYEGTVIDITQRRKSEERLKLISQAFEHSLEGILITDAETNIIEVNKALCGITGYSAEELIGNRPNMLSSDSYDKEFYKEMWDELNAKGLWQGEMKDRKKSGEVYEEYLTICAITDEEDKVINYIGICSDISEKKSSEEHIHKLAYYDILTGLPNRVLFQDRLKHAIERSRRRGFSVALFFIDLDNFKIINDTLGHHMGDLFLQQVVERIEGTIRHENTFARLGGDEFTVIIEELGDSTEAARVAKKIIDAVSKPFDLEGRDIFSSASIGITIFPQDASNIGDLIKNADTAMYRVKGQGKNDFEFFTPDMNVENLNHLMMESNLRSAIEGKEFILHYQPQFNPYTGKVSGMEALIRWQSPVLGFVPPGKFISFAEKTALIIPIGQWVLEEACRQVVEWKRAGLDVPSVAVNVSPRQLRSETFLEDLDMILKRRGMNPMSLQIEITEGALMENLEETIEKLNAIKKRGINIQIDDFGTGYSSLGYLKRFPIDKLKIDISFIKDIPEDKDDIAITSAIIAMSKSLGLKVLAEGVEREAQLNFLTGKSCDEVQGYYYSRPLAADDMKTLLEGGGVTNVKIVE